MLRVHRLAREVIGWRLYSVIGYDSLPVNNNVVGLEFNPLSNHWRTGGHHIQTIYATLSLEAKVAIGRAHDLETLGVLECQPHTGKRSADSPPTRWPNYINRVAGSRWTQAAKTMVFGTHYKIPLSNRGRNLAVMKVMMMMIK
ncbi:jg15293 [Pararge aegeria aegeria]|uniref:Jg15293 protein n=1 Tax=Pararge aegeria aegeria TaxID=348720 RepID=A0A8S4R501_9NEOP|nr:jg15293 [Pararge aegeria aegeria]